MIIHRYLEIAVVTKEAVVPAAVAVSALHVLEEVVAVILIVYAMNDLLSHAYSIF